MGLCGKQSDQLCCTNRHALARWLRGPAPRWTVARRRTHASGRGSGWVKARRGLPVLGTCCSPLLPWQSPDYSESHPSSRLTSSKGHTSSKLNSSHSPCKQVLFITVSKTWLCLSFGWLYSTSSRFNHPSGFTLSTSFLSPFKNLSGGCHLS